jgi:hypothetical protein
LNNKQQKETVIPLDIRCSTVCTRAAITALILSAIAISMIRPIKETLALNALREYITLRNVLKIELNELENDSYWESLKNSKLGNQAVNEWNIATLLGYECTHPLIEPNEKPNPTTEILNENQIILKWKEPTTSMPDGRPSPPADFRIVWQIPNIVETSNILTKLGNLEMIELARSVSDKFDREIYLWELFRYRMLTKNIGMIPTGKKTLTFSLPSDQKIPELYTEDKTSFNRKTLLEYLTLHNVKELSDYRFPDSKDLDFFIRDLSKFKLPTLQQPIGFKYATILTAIGIALSVFYFWMYQREAKSSETYPAPGTMFGVFSRTRFTRLIFLMLSVLPLAASVLLAIYTTPLTYITIVFAILVCIFSILIVKESNMFKLKQP